MPVVQPRPAEGRTVGARMLRAAKNLTATVMCECRAGGEPGLGSGDRGIIAMSVVDPGPVGSMAGGQDDFADGVGLAQAIALLRGGLLEARSAAGDSDIQLPVESMTVELRVVATRTRDGKAGFAVPFAGVELGGSAGWQREAMQTVTVVFSAPIDREGRPVKVAQETNKRKG